jgi:hypothetical protein
VLKAQVEVILRKEPHHLAPAALDFALKIFVRELLRLLITQPGLEFSELRLRG